MEKKDNILHYYEAEMQYLNKAAKDFAELHPDSAKYLKMENSLERDPMIERLFEGFSFLTAKLYQKIDDDYPELTENILGLLWPQYLQPIPSLSIIQLLVNEKIHTGLQHIDAGLPLQTAEDPDTKITCEYRTTEPIDIYPLELNDAKLVYNDLGTSIIQLKLQLCNSEFSNVIQIPDKFNLKIYLSGQIETKLTLLHFLVNYVSHITTDRDFINTDNDLTISRVHFDQNSVTWRNNKKVSERDIMLEYLLFREKFLFFEIQNIHKRHFCNSNKSLIINCHLNHDFPIELNFNKNYFNLFCAPVINIFDLETEPIIRSGFKNKYELSPIHNSSNNISIYAVNNVESFNQYTGKRKHYLPFHEFKHGNSHPNVDEENKPYYYVSCKENVNNTYNSYITFGGDFVFDGNEILSISATGTNMNLPRQICKYNKLLKLMSPVVGIKNAQIMTLPTAIQYPPNFTNQHWQILFESSNNYLSILDVDTLKNSLYLLNWSSSTINKKYINSIQSLDKHIKYILHHGMMIRYLAIDIELNCNHFINEGDAALFSFAINEFFAEYIQLNLAIKITFTLQPNNVQLTWPIEIDKYS